MSIKNWNEDDRPREKFHLKGKKSCSDSEVLAILIGMGTRDASAVDIAKKILQANNNSLEKISQLSIQDLTKYKGIGLAKAITISAALELGSRKIAEMPIKKAKVSSSFECFQYLHTYFTGLNHEEFYVLLLSKANTIIRIEKLSMGSTDATLVDMKLLTKIALDHLATGIIVAHNHPSGNLTPSSQDISLTDKIYNALKLFDITLLDHLIIYENQYYSFADKGRLNTNN